MPSIQSFIAEARQILKKTPYDVAHDISHHGRVWENAQRIMESVPEPVEKEMLQAII